MNRPTPGQVRVYEKAQADYAKRFNDDGLPEACVADMLRGRAVCKDGHLMLILQELLREPFEMRVEGEGAHMKLVKSGGDVVRLELVRCKNKSSPKAVGAPFAAPCRRYRHTCVALCTS